MDPLSFVLVGLALVVFGGVVKKGQELVGDATDGTEKPFPPVPGVLMKPGVIFDAIRPETIRAIAVAKGAFERHGFGPVVVTSVQDGTHLPTSFHYRGLAVDMRTRHLSIAQALELRKSVAAELGDSYDVISEGPGPGYDRQAAGAHLHAEFDP